MKILQVISSLETGGAQKLLSDLLPLIAEKHEVTLLVNKDINNIFTQKIKNSNVRYICSNLPNLYSLKNYFVLRKMIGQYDIIHVHLFPLIYWVSIASIFKKTNLIYTEHSTSNKRRDKWYFRPIERWMYSRYKRIISISQQTQDAIMTWLKADSNDKRFTIVNNGIKLSAFHKHKESSNSKRNIIMVSRFVPSKDQITVIRALTMLPDNINVTFLGDGETMNRCKNEAERLGVRERIVFAGQQDDITTWFTKADIAIQSSNWEGFGLAAVEAMAAGLPVIASNVDGLRQVVEGAGLLFPKGDAKTLSKLILQTLTDNSVYQEISEKCRNRSLLYDIQNTANLYVSIYEEVVEE